MNKEFVPYEQALALKELGFNDYCLTSYLNGNLQTGISEIFWFQHSYRSHKKQEFVSAPTFSQAFRWFREKYGLPSWIYTSNNKEYWYSVLKDGRMLVRDYKPFETYEEAELACLKKLIEIVKQ